ncbi:hypothetical protein KW805_01440 [Candidatus Pacearchaeota archaeon]|nr:hypothetical protein [Candidatus Pacearchaeota archaeon]
MSSTQGTQKESIGHYLSQKLGGKILPLSDTCDRLELENIDVQSASHIAPLLDKHYREQGFIPTPMTLNCPDHRIYIKEGSSSIGVKIEPNVFLRRVILEIYKVESR